jgi:hypothetical protein
MIDLQAELKQRIQALYEIALDFLSEEEARDLFCSVTKRTPPLISLGPSLNFHKHRMRLFFVRAIQR